MSPTRNDLENPPADIWEVNQRLHFDEPLEPGDERWVDTAAARGEFSYAPIYRSLGVDPQDWRLRGAPRRAYVLFCGHRGCGKSTELRRIHQKLDRPDLFFAVLLDVAKALDPNNIQYQDVLLALAEALLKKLDKNGIELDNVHLSRLRTWFDERVEKHEATRQFAAEVKAGAKSEVGIPFLSKLFAELTTAFRVNSTYKEELRRLVRNHFSEFAEAFNQLIQAAEQACEERGLGRRVLFLVDGTDKQRGDDAESFFVKDVHQLQQVEALFLYSTPIHLVHSGTALKEGFSATFILPMIKTAERDGTPNPTGLEAMREILFRRAPVDLFDEPSTAEYLVEHCGGHPRDLLRLLQYSFQQARGDRFDRAAAERAVRALATDYRQFLYSSDYSLLREVDAESSVEHNSDRARFLLYNLALLEYNTYWWRSHPVVRTLPAYQDAPRS